MLKLNPNVHFRKQQLGSNVTRTSSHGISFSSRVGHRGVGGSHSKMTAASGSRWNVNDKGHHKPPVQVSFILTHNIICKVDYYWMPYLLDSCVFDRKFNRSCPGCSCASDHVTL